MFEVRPRSTDQESDILRSTIGCRLWTSSKWCEFTAKQSFFRIEIVSLEEIF